MGPKVGSTIDLAPFDLTAERVLHIVGDAQTGRGKASALAPRRSANRKIAATMARPEGLQIAVQRGHLPGDPGAPAGWSSRICRRPRRPVGR